MRHKNFKHDKPHTEEAKKKMRDAFERFKKSDKYPLFLEEARKRAKSSKTKFKKGHKALTNGKNLVGLQAGETHWNWKGGISEESHRLRGTANYINWRDKIFKRDDYTCQLCGIRGTYIEADHYPIPFFVLFKEKNFEIMWDISNGRTLCRPCHDGTKKDWRKYAK